MEALKNIKRIHWKLKKKKNTIREIKDIFNGHEKMMQAQGKNQ